MSRPPVVEFLTLVLSHYRVPFHTLVRDDLARDGIDYRVTYSEPQDAAARKSDTADLDWATKVPVRTFSVGGKALYWQSAWPIVRSADLVIASQENKLLLNYLLVAGQYASGPRLAFFGHGRNHQSTRPNGLSETMKRMMAVRAHWWFAYTPGVADLVECYGFPRERITINYNAIDTAALKADLDTVSVDDMTSARRALDIPGSGRIGLYVGGLYAEKRLDFLVQAARRIREQIPDFHLVVVGDGPMRNVVEDAARAHPFIHAAGPRFGRQKAALLKSAGVFLMPGLVGLAILDSFTAGCPLVTTNVAYHSPEIDYLVNGENGLMVDAAESVEAYGDAVAALLGDEAYRLRLAEGARRSASQYTIERMARSVADGIRKALAQDF